MRTRSLLITLALVLVAVGGVAYSLWRDADQVRTLLTAADEDADAARTALARDRDPATAMALMASGVERTEQAATIVQRVTWDAAAQLPYVGDDVQAVRAATLVAESGALVAASALEPAAALASDEGLGALLDGARVDVETLRSLGASLDAIDTDLLAQRSELLSTLDDSDLIPLVEDARRRALSASDELLAAVDDGGAAIDGLVDLLGGDGERTYLLAAQNPSELRGTGGLIGRFAEITASSGSFRITDGAEVDTEDLSARRAVLSSIAASRDRPPVERPADFAARYDVHGGGQWFGTVNMDPDLPTVAPVLLRLYERETGKQLDGVILIDPIALGDIVTAMGRPLQLPTDLDTAGLPRQLSGAALPSAIMSDGYNAFDGGGPDKKAFDKAVVDTAFQQLFSADWPAAPMIQALRQSVQGRHLQAWSAHEEAQTAILLGDVGADMGDASERDLLAAVAINGAENKADVHVAHRLTAAIELDRPLAMADETLRRDLAFDFAVENPLLPGQFNTYITGATDLTRWASPDQTRRENAMVRTFINVWVPERTYATTLFDTAGGTLLDYDRVHGLRVIDAFLETPSASTTSLAFTATGEVPAFRDGDTWVYEVELWRQAKAIPDHWDLTIGPPSGWTVVDAEVIGGGDGVGMGVGGDGTPLVASFTADEARVSGAATADAIVRVTLTP